MAEIRPLRAWRYNSRLSQQIEELTSPLFDVVSEKQLEKLRKNSLNSIHLSVPDGSDHAARVRSLSQQWKKDGIIEQDDKPCIYVYYQYFKIHGDDRLHCRKGFIANLRVYDWDEKVLLRHENTMPHSVEDRMEVLGAAQMNISPTHGLYTDPSHSIESFLDDSMNNPIYDVEDYQGVRDVFSVIEDPEVIREIIELLEEKQIILADGHHRYESSLHYMKNRRASNPNHTGNEGYNFHLMYFTNTESDDLRILPTHRLVSGLEGFDHDNFMAEITKYFTVKPMESEYDLGEIILGKPYAFGLYNGREAFKIRLKEGLEKEISWNFPDVINSLELTVLHYYLIEKCLGIPGKEQRAARTLTFERNMPECINRVSSGDAQLAIITQDISIETVKKVCYSGHTLPQKSTYFYPKVICGFLFGSIHPEEFD